MAKCTTTFPHTPLARSCFSVVCPENSCRNSLYRPNRQPLKLRRGDWVPYRALCLALCLPLGLAWPTALHAAPPTATEALSLRPVQANVEYDRVAVSEQSQCSVRDLSHEEWSGWEVVSPEGVTLRVFADTNGDKKVDRWCYFASGVEVYRDIDENYNGKADQYRWLGTNGSKWGLDENEDGRIDQWRSLSAEELSDEAIQAIQRRDSQSFEALLATQEELVAAGIALQKMPILLSQLREAKERFETFSKTQGQITETSRWLQFAANRPSMIPSGTLGSTQDLTLYDNAVALFQTTTNGTKKTGQIYLGSLLLIEKSWKLLALPTFDQTVSLKGNAFTVLAGMNAIEATRPEAVLMSEATETLITQLEKIDSELAKMMTLDTPEMGNVAPQLNQQRADVLEKLVTSSPSGEESDIWMRELVDMLAITAQTGAYPGAAERLSRLAASLQDNTASVTAYASFQSITTDYLVNQIASDDLASVQTTYLTALESFVQTFPTSPQAAEAWNQIALQKEFEDQDEKAASIYQKIVDEFPESPQAGIARGAVKRIESVGERIDLKGNTVAGARFQLSNLRGKLVVMHYWASWCSPCLQDIKALQQLRATYSGANLAFVGINVDASRQKTEAYLNGNPIPWPQLFDEGGLEGSELSRALGIQTLPAMFLIDQDGRVLNNDLRLDELQGELAKRLR